MLCVFSQRAIKCHSVSEVSVVNGGPPPSFPSLHSWEEAPPIEATEAECAGLKALSPVHRLQVAPGSLATRLDGRSLHAGPGKHKDSCIPQLTRSIREVAVDVWVWGDFSC